MSKPVPDSPRYIHLDAIGGVAGDMFVAALLDALPELWLPVERAVRAVARPDILQVALHEGTSNAIAGRRFVVTLGAAAGQPDAGSTALTFASIRERIGASGLPAVVAKHAVGIFRLLAEAESHVHNVGIDEVHFHELGDWDSVADIVAAAALIYELDGSSWSVSALPLGRGTVNTRHGPLPVPAPATARLLLGYSFRDDGIDGERVTPTGAAILRYIGALQPAEGSLQPRRLTRSGYGLGTRELPGIGNALRALVFDTVRAQESHERVAQLVFNIDDQSGEDLAIALDNLRAETAVLDIIQLAAVGKKGRLTTQVQVLARAEQLDAVVALCFHETTTLGVRTQLIERRVLERHDALADTAAGEVRIKVAQRGGASTVKAESDDLRNLPGGYAGRQGARRKAETHGDDS